MTAHDKTSSARPHVLKGGDYVLYRDPALFWTGQPGHTKVCRVIVRYTTGHLELHDVVADRLVRGADPAYVRWLAPADAMRDIDTAPLNEPGPVTAMNPAAVAWLRQQLGEPAPTQA